MNGLIFDLDGTLIDSAPDIQAAVNKMLAEEGISPLDLATVISFIGNGMPKLVERVLHAVQLPLGDDHPQPDLGVPRQQRQRGVTRAIRRLRHPGLARREPAAEIMDKLVALVRRPLLESFVVPPNSH